MIARTSRLCISCLFVLSFVALGQSLIPAQCPTTSNCTVPCVSQSESDCKPNEILIANPDVCGCCLQCIGGAGLGTACNNNDNVKCAPGLKCVQRKCEYDKESCLFVKHIKDSQLIIVPTCAPDGSYAAAQCKGERHSGRCFCYSRTGTRIFGWDWWRNVNGTAGSTMTCPCSRQRFEETAKGRTDVTLHCKSNGDFEALQCDSGVCWCADETTGNLVDGTLAVPDDLWTLLPCYNATIYGDKYLRQCDSVAFAQNLFRSTMAERGTTGIRFNSAQCHYDGTYGTFQIQGNIANCIWRDGTVITPYQVMSNVASRMDCYCARDQRIFAAEGLTLPLTCSANGNYQLLQDLDDETFCVDQDGFVVSPPTSDGATTITIESDCHKYVYYLH